MAKISSSHLKLCIVLPAFNEEASIKRTILEYQSEFPTSQIIVVDNNSTDNTRDIAVSVLQTPDNLVVIERRQGKGHALRTAVSRIDSDIYVIADADYTYHASDAVRLVNLMLKGRHDMVVGDRISGGAYSSQNHRLGHSVGNLLISRIISLLMAHKFNDVLSGLRVISRPFASTLEFGSSGFQIETELNISAAYINADVVEAPIQYRQRPTNSVSKLHTVKDGLRIIQFAFASWFTFAPMQPFLICAFLFGTTSVYLAHRVVSGFLSTGLAYSTTAIAGAALGLVAVLAMFVGILLTIIGKTMRRTQIALFLERKRAWNRLIDNK